jgi:hypothetical protein
VWIEHSIPGIDARNFVVQEIGIERCVVRNQHGIFDEFQPAGRHIGEERRLLNHLVGYAR